MCDCSIFRMLPHISAQCAYRIFFLHKLAFSTAILIILIFFVFLLESMRIVNNIWSTYTLVIIRKFPPNCPVAFSGQELWALANVGDSLHWLSSLHGIYNSVISTYFRHVYSVCTVCIFFKCRTKLTCLNRPLIWLSGNFSAGLIQIAA